MRIMTKTEWQEIVEYYQKYVKKYNFLFFLYIVISSISKGLMLLLPLLNSLVIDNIIASKIEQVFICLGCMGIVFLLQAIFSYAETHINVSLMAKIQKEVKSKVFESILHLKVFAYNQTSTSKYISVMEGDIGVVSSFYFTSIIAVITNIISIIISGIFVFKFSIVLSIIGLLSFPLNIIIYKIFGEKIRKIQNKLRHVTDENINVLQESLLGIKEVKGLGIESTIKEKYFKTIDNVYTNSIKSGITSARGGLVQLLLGNALMIFQTVIASIFMISGSLTIGSYVAFSSYLSQFVNSFKQLSSLNISIQKAIVSINRINECIDPSLIEYDFEGKEKRHIDTSISGSSLCINNISFKYANNCKVIDNVSLKIGQNEIVTIVGKSGSGKTTLLNLLMRFYDLDEGTITLDGNDISVLDLPILRKKITYVQQVSFLFNDTIKNNLLLAKEDATDSELIEVCQQAFLQDFINTLPKGLDTYIGEQGTCLSGGQRQRLAIARGILRNSKYFLFDEITSDLDGEAEGYLVKMLNNLSKKHTIIMVAHRLSTVINMPRIVVMDAGRIIAEGDHSSLIAQNNIYKALFSKDNI